MKIKVDQIRTYDEAGFRRRAACLCFKSECESEVLLVSSSRFHDTWIVPGGGLEPGEDPATTAVREVNEEAGVIGKLGRLLDVFENRDRKTRTYVYVLIVEKLVKDYDDACKIGRLRRWFSIDDAFNMLSQHKPVQQEYIDKLCRDEVHLAKVSMCSEASLARSPSLPCTPVSGTETTPLSCFRCSRGFERQSSCGSSRDLASSETDSNEDGDRCLDSPLKLEQTSGEMRLKSGQEC